ncbi:structural maintenance of chromosomes protein 4 isoform X1 [Glycine max]|uniref:structural maintenance of chromosomes protein 4 isoform X1 n=1 Tax=Glycine max TaxID=3847 RepID=UPI001B355769|nr:structural maintenance of chromosomes protein 4 isoform X1 [Glycine max]
MLSIPKLEALIKKGEESTVLIPKLEDNIPKLQKLLLDEEKVLEEITESSKVETEKYRSELAKVRAELEPWEKDLIEHNGKLEVACTEAKLLNDKVRMTSLTFKCYCSVHAIKLLIPSAVNLYNLNFICVMIFSTFYVLVMHLTNIKKYKHKYPKKNNGCLKLA